MEIIEPRETPVKWTPLLILTGVTIIIGSSIPAGFHFSVINTPAEVIRAWFNDSISSRYHYTMSASEMDIMWSSFICTTTVGSILASLAGSCIADRFGRKCSLRIVIALSLTSSILYVTSPYANSLEVLFLARFVCGLANGLGDSVIVLYLIEVGHIKQRGTLGMLYRLGFAIGILLAESLSLNSVLGTKSEWHFLLTSHGVLALMASLAMPFLPESPKYLYVIRGDKNRCVKELVRLRDVPADSLKAELDDMEENYKLQQAAKAGHTLLSVVKSSSYRLPLVLVVLLRITLVWAGGASLIGYSSRIFLSVGFSTTKSEYFTLSIGCMEVVMSLITMYTLRRIGRKTLLLFSVFMSAFLEVLLSMTFVYKDTVTWMPYLSIALVLGVMFCLNIGIVPIPGFIANELFVVGPASVAMSYSTATTNAGLFSVGIAFPIMQEALQDYTFLPSAGLLIATGIFLWFYLPETKGRNPKDIAAMVSQGFGSRIK